MKAIRKWYKLALAAGVLISCNTVIAQSSYKVTDLGALHNGVIGCAMGLNNRGWTESMDGYLDSSGTFIGRAAMNLDGLKFDLGTLGGPDSWINWGGINEQGEAVGLAESSVLDPNGEDFCAFGTKLTCRPFLWKNGVMRALPTLGGNNGQASAINKRGQITGQAQTTVTEAACAPYQTALPVIWQGSNVQELPTVAADPDGFAIGINDQGQAVGTSGNCSSPFINPIHAVLWENGIATELPNLGGATNNQAIAINNQGQIVGQVSSADGSTFYAALWQNGALTNLGTLSGDFASIATGINSKGQVVGSTLDSSFNWAHAFIWENGVMTDLNTLLPANSNLYATMANKINSRGQISGMATVLSGPDAGNIHAFLATPVNASAALSVAAVVTKRPQSTMSANMRKQLLQRLGLGRY
jgi:probable HAF family extracellular repeat protein